MHTQPLFQYSKCITKSMDEFIPALGSVFEGLLIEPSHSKNANSHACFSHTNQAAFSLSNIYYGQETTAAYEIQKNLHIISVITNGSARYSWHSKREQSANRVNFLPANVFMDMEFTTNCNQVLIALPSTEVLSRVHEKLYLNGPRDPILKRQIQILVHDLVWKTHYTKNAHMSDKHLGNFHNELMDALLCHSTLYDQSALHNSKNCLPRKGVRKTIDFIHANPDWDFNIEFLSSLCHASVRTYYYNFKSATGITPYQYYLNVRLSQVRVEILKIRDKQLSIAEIAMGSGFFHLSRFASQYRNLFGELPSETLHNSLKLIRNTKKPKYSYSD